MRKLRFTAARLATVSILAMAATSALAEPAVQETAKAPTLMECEVAASNDLGTWDDAFVCPDQDFLVLRRGDGLYLLSMVGPTKPKKLRTTPAADKTRIVAAAAVEERLWLFLNSPRMAPVAIDAHSGEVVNFEIPGLAIPGEQTPGIQSHVLVPHTRAALLMIAGGDRVTWPRDGNRPLYFWMDLITGKVIRLPTGWDLDYFSAKQEVAVFAAVHEMPLERRPWQALEMRTGALKDETPDRRKQLCIPFDWGETHSLKPLYGRREKSGDADFFAGLSQNGRASPLEIDLEGRQYMAMAKASDGFVGFRLRHQGASRGEPSPYWIASIDNPQERERVAAGVTDFALLRRGSGAFVTAGHGRKEVSSEAWFHGYDKSTWNVLEGMERLPPLEKRFAAADYVEDRMQINLIESFGTAKFDPLLICLFSHQRGDRRALTPFQEGIPLESKTWRRAIALTSAGQRFLTPLFRDENLPEVVWLHHSGKLIRGKFAWHSVGEKRERQIQLTETALQVPREGD